MTGEKPHSCYCCICEKNLEGRGSARIYIQERSLTYEIKNCSQRSIFHSCFRVHGERKHKINKSSCSLFLQTKVLLGKMHASSLSQCVTCCYKSDPGKLPVYKGVVIIHQHEFVLEQVDQLDPSGILVHWCENFEPYPISHIITNKQSNKQTNKQTNKHLGKRIYASHTNSQLIHLPLILAL